MSGCFKNHPRLGRILLPLFWGGSVLAIGLASGCLPPSTPRPLYSEVLAPRVTVTRSNLVLNQAIFFEFDSDRILPISFPILDEVAKTLTVHPEIGRVRIEGHTDSVGGVTYNLNLSNRRAQSVRKYVEDKGVKKGRLIAIGFGPSQPIADNQSEDGRAKNRRVSFVIERWAGPTPELNPHPKGGG